MAEPAGFLRSAKVISALTLGSRVLGLVRDMLFAYVFGAKEVMSAFQIGFQVPNLFRRLFGEGALSASSIPVLSEQLRHGGTEAVDRLGGKLMALLLLVLTVLVVVGELAVLALWPLLSHTANDIPIRAGLTQNQLTLALTAVMLPYMIFICASAILGGIQNIFGQFAVPAANPILLNVFEIAAMIAGVWLFAHDLVPQAYLLGVTVVFTGIVQLSWQWTSVRKVGLRLPLRIDTKDPAFRLIARTMVPMTIGLSVVQINTLLDGLIAYRFVTSHPGGPAVLGYAQRLYQFPLGVFAIALATAIFPAMSRAAAGNDMAGLSQTLARGLRIVVFEGLPCTIGLILIREPLVEALFQRGMFTATATARVAATLATFAAGVWAFGINQIAVRAFYAMKDQMTPLRIAAWMVAGNLVLNLLLVGPLEEPGIGLATTICAVIQDVWLLRGLVRRLPGLAWREVVGSAGRTAVATALMALSVMAVQHVAPAWPLYARSAAVRVAVLTTTGAAAFALAAWVVRCQELREIIRRH